MHRLGVIVDPPGYKNVAEEGFSIRWTGADLMKRGWLTEAEGFWNPPRSDWVLPRPKQFNPEWYADPDLGDYVIGMSNWAFAANVDHSENFYPRKTPGASYPADVGINFGAIPASLGAQPISVNFTTGADSIQSQAGVTLPTGIGVVAATTALIGAWVTPHIEFARFPKPEDLIVFGFGPFCVLWYERKVIVLRMTDEGHQVWERVGTFFQSIYRPQQHFNPASFVAVSSTVDLRTMTIVPVGWSDLYFVSAPDEDPWIVPTRRDDTPVDKVADTPSISTTGKWWIAGYPTQRLLGQVQYVGYPAVTHIEIGTGTLDSAKRFFDLTSEYTPTQDPVICLDGFLPMVEGDFSNTGDVTGAGGWGASDPDGGTVAAQVVDEAHAIWVSDGTHYRGAVSLNIAQEIGAFATPQIRELQLTFPPLLEDGSATDQLLTDEHFMHGWRVSASLHELEGKTVRIPLTTAGADLLRSAGLDYRHDIAVHVVEDTDDDDTYPTVRFRGWVTDGTDTEELVLVANNPAAPLDDMTIIGKGLLARADEAWVYRAEILDPANAGKLAHTYAVEVALWQSGFDPDDPDAVQISTDTAADEFIYLPGIRDDTGPAGEKRAGPYAPDFDETKLHYIGRVRDEWTGTWLLYEEAGGRVLYKPDPVASIEDYGATLSVDAVFYRTRAAAVAAGQNPRQKYRQLSQRVIRPVKSNVVRIVPADPNQPQVFCRDRASKDDPTYENFVGRWVRTTVEQPKLAVNVGASRNVAISYLRRSRRRIIERQWKCLLAPWEIGIAPSPAGIEVGSIVQLHGGATYQIVHLEAEGQGPGIVETSIVGWKLPTAPVFAGD